MHPAYFETRFRTPTPPERWPAEFVILSACASTGESWTPAQNSAADGRLADELAARGGWRVRIVGYSPVTSHAEPSWAVDMPLDAACDVGLRFQQDAIFHVRDGRLSVTHCDARRTPIVIDDFFRRLDAGGTPT